MGRNLNPTVEKMLGQILVERNIISPGFLHLALDRQKKEEGKYKYIGEVLLEMGVPQQKIEVVLVENSYNWNPDKDKAKKFELGKVALEVIKEVLDKKDKEGKVTTELLSLFEKFK